MPASQRGANGVCLNHPSFRPESGLTSKAILIVQNNCSQMAVQFFVRRHRPPCDFGSTYKIIRKIILKWPRHSIFSLWLPVNYHRPSLLSLLPQKHPFTTYIRLAELPTIIFNLSLLPILCIRNNFAWYLWKFILLCLGNYEQDKNK